MENNDNKSKDLKVKIARFLREKGVYIVLFACLAVVGRGGCADVYAGRPESGADAGQLIRLKKRRRAP